MSVVGHNAIIVLNTPRFVVWPAYCRVRDAEKVAMHAMINL